MDLTKDTFHRYISENDLVLVDFYAKWCPPCQRFFKILPKLQESVKDICVIGKVETDSEELLANVFQIKNIPTFVLFKHGIDVYRWEGIKTISEMELIIRDYING